MKGGILHINGTAVKLEDIGDYSIRGDRLKPSCSGKHCRRAFPIIVISITDNSIGDDTHEFAVPMGEYFVLGDNSDNSTRQPLHRGDRSLRKSGRQGRAAILEFERHRLFVAADAGCSGRQIA